jgi:membrane associated rhomboid family serine protease
MDGTSSVICLPFLFSGLYWNGFGKFLVFYLFTGLGASILFSLINFFEIRQIEVAAQEYVADPGPDSFQSFITEHAEHLYSRNYGFIEQFHENPQDPGIIEQSKQFVNSFYNRMANIPMVGASGAVFGILMAFGYLFPNTTLMLLIPPIPIKAKYFVTFYGLYELYAGIQRMPGDNVAHFAHIGGMLFAFILIKLWKTKRGEFY